MLETRYPRALTQVDQIEAVPRRIRGAFAAETVFDTTSALYLWEWPYYPQFLIPSIDVDPDILTHTSRTHRLKRGTVETIGLRVGDRELENAGRRYVTSNIVALRHMIRFDWQALDAWFEEDEEVFVHPRSPYVRVDALRSRRQVRVERDGMLLAQSDATIMVFETGLPTRYYFDPSAVNFSALTATDTVTACPYKGRTSQYWSVQIGAMTYKDLAWSYNFPTRQLLPIAGLVAFYDEQVDVMIDGVAQPRPATHFFASEE